MNYLASQEITNIVQKEFNEIKSEIEEMTLFGSFEDIEKELSVNEILLRFHLSPNATHIAFAWLDPNNRTIDFNSAKVLSFKTTIIHELAHHLVQMSNIRGQSGAHCLEFAIITYALQNKLCSDPKHTATFFKSYDVHEDICYPFLRLSPMAWDTMIKSIQFSSLRSLCNQAQVMAKKIRAKYATTV